MLLAAQRPLGKDAKSRCLISTWPPTLPQPCSLSTISVVSKPTPDLNSPPTCSRFPTGGARLIFHEERSYQNPPARLLYVDTNLHPSHSAPHALRERSGAHPRRLLRDRPAVNEPSSALGSCLLLLGRQAATPQGCKCREQHMRTAWAQGLGTGLGEGRDGRE